MNLCRFGLKVQVLVNPTLPEIKTHQNISVCACLFIVHSIDHSFQQRELPQYTLQCMQKLSPLSAVPVTAELQLSSLDSDVDNELSLYQHLRYQQKLPAKTLSYLRTPGARFPSSPFVAALEKDKHLTTNKPTHLTGSASKVTGLPATLLPPTTQISMTEPSHTLHRP